METVAIGPKFMEAGVEELPLFYDGPVPRRVRVQIRLTDTLASTKGFQQRLDIEQAASC